MRFKDVKKACRYFARALKNPFLKANRIALKRYIVESFVFVLEKARGLDFTMVYQCDSNEHNNNYSKSPKRVLNRIFNDIDYNKEHSFMDMGSGKGYVIACASSFPFKLVGGVEYSKELFDICKKNIKRLKLNKINVYNCDAKEFDRYKDYDIFYFCNPFDETILSVVAHNIWEAHKDNECWIYYLNPHQHERQKAITNAGFNLIKKIKDKTENYFDINVYKN